ncbi:unnamed protein product [Cyprideis torosa]|uniref:Uncharacterized protein n=2 Tax=Cyprideis torosa TaxID=163714 RepID=A0A7R8WL17_9CRUS|nr:unnamed protein product [Cyprideis torosa]CAG0897517.1 unnamed protein product [Cyprideis torosa]
MQWCCLPITPRINGGTVIEQSDSDTEMPFLGGHMDGSKSMFLNSIYVRPSLKQEEDYILEKKTEAREAGLFRTEISPSDFAEELLKERQLYQLQVCEYLLKTNEIQGKKGVDLIGHLVEYYHAQSRFFMDGLKVMDQFGSYVKDLSSRLSTIKKSHDQERKQLLELRKMLGRTDEEGLLDSSMTATHSSNLPGYQLHPISGRKEEGTQKSGFLLKKSDGKMRRVWQKRRCQIQDGFLCISHSDGTKPPSRINLLTSQIKVHPEDKKCFDLVAHNRTYHFQGEDEMSAASWISVLTNCRESLLQETFRENSRGDGPIGEIQRQLVREIHSLPGNDRCADCSSQNDVTWLSTNLGVLFCIECSGIHRDLGVHISRVQSLTLDHVGTSHLLVARRMSNRTFNEVMEATLSRGLKPTPTSSMDERYTFIRSKYVDRKFIIRSNTDKQELQVELEHAVRTKQLPLLLEAWSEGADLTVLLRDTGETALHLAIAMEDGRTLEIVDFIVQNSPSLESMNADRETPLMMCARLHSRDCAKLLLRSGADASPAAMEIAEETGDQGMIELLNHARANKKALFENVTVDWLNHRHSSVASADADFREEISTDMSEDEMMPPDDFMGGEGFVTPIGRRPGTGNGGSTAANMLPGTAAAAAVLLMFDLPEGSRQGEPAVERSRQGEPAVEGSRQGEPALNHARANKKALFENVTVDWLNHRHSSVASADADFREEISTDMSEDEMMPPDDFMGGEGFVTPIGRRPGTGNGGSTAANMLPGSTSSLKKRVAPPPPQHPMRYPRMDHVPLAGARLVLPTGPAPTALRMTNGAGPINGPSSVPPHGDTTAGSNNRGSLSPRFIAATPGKGATVPATPCKKTYENCLGKRCRALYDCDADNEDELTFREGEVIVITNVDTEDDMWLEGRIEGSDRRTGLFPVSFVHMLNE